MRQREYEPQGRLAYHLKDVRLMVTLADEVGATVPTTRLHAELLARAVEAGLGDADNSAIVELLRRDDPGSGPS